MLLKKLTEASGVSGNENEVRSIVIDEIKDYVDDIKMDNIGNIIVYKKGKVNTPKLMVTAHLDEVGLMIVDIDDSGLLKFVPVGGIDKRVLVSKPVKVGKDKIQGVIGAKPIHLQKRTEWENALDIEDLYIDIGVNNKGEAEKLVSIGDYVTFDTGSLEFGNNLIKAKALDNRVGCSLLIDLLKEESNFSYYGVFTVMEEVGLRGAGPAAFSVEPDLSIILEGTLCSDMPKAEVHEISTGLGEGPAISLMDRTTVYNIKLRERIVSVAKKNNIPYQYRKTTFGGNDSGKIHLTKEGSITTTISVPCRYIHSPVSVMSKDDYENTFKLLKAVLKDIEEEGL